MPTNTTAPYSAGSFEMLMERLGYELCPGYTGYEVSVHWQKRKGKKLPKEARRYPKVLTCPGPSHTADGYDKLVYDRNAVTDFFMRIVGVSNPTATKHLNAVLKITNAMQPAQHQQVPAAASQQPAADPGSNDAPQAESAAG